MAIRNSKLYNLGFVHIVFLFVAFVIALILGWSVLSIYNVVKAPQDNEVKQVDSEAKPVDNEVSESDILMVVRYQGGLCADNKICSEEYKLYGDGSFDEHTDLSSSELKKLKQLINKTDFLKYEKETNPNCQSFVDGSDEILEFPSKYPDKSFTLCTLQIPSDDETINYINALIEKHKVD